MLLVLFRNILRTINHAVQELIDSLHWYFIRRRKHPMARMMQGSLAHESSKQPLLLTSAVEAWHKAIGVPYSENIDLLERLWNASFDDTDTFSAKHVKWKEIGFQNECPASDFRGGGVLSLQCLVYMAETYPDTYKALVCKTNGPRSEYDYPFAASYIHMVFTLLDTLQLRNLHVISRYSDGFLRAVMMQDHEDLEVVFQEMSVQAMILLDDVWVSSSASYIDFPSVKQDVCRHIQRVVSKRWFDTPSLILSEYSKYRVEPDEYDVIMDFLNKKSWHPGSFKNRKKVYLAEEQQRESEKKHKALLEEYKAEAVCDTTDTRVAFLYSAPPGFPTLHPTTISTREKDDGVVREKRPGVEESSTSHISRVVEGIRTREVSTPADEEHVHASSRSFVVNEFENEDEEQEAYELAMIQDASTRSRLFRKQQNKKKRRKLRDARKILAEAGLL